MCEYLNIKYGVDINNDFKAKMLLKTFCNCNEAQNHQTTYVQKQKKKKVVSPHQSGQNKTAQFGG